jgi:hypothetical protein
LYNIIKATGDIFILLTYDIVFHIMMIIPTPPIELINEVQEHELKSVGGWIVTDKLVD